MRFGNSGGGGGDWVGFWSVPVPLPETASTSCLDNSGDFLIPEKSTFNWSFLPMPSALSLTFEMKSEIIKQNDQSSIIKLYTPKMFYQQHTSSAHVKSDKTFE